MVGIPQPETRLKDFPHQFSGGMRQRVMIAMALALEPKLLIADEPTTALDVTIQAQVLDLLAQLHRARAERPLILITHDLGVVAGMTQRINVMYAGYIVETASTEELFATPVASLHGRAAALDPAARRRRRRGADPDRGPAAGHAARADRLPVRAALRLAPRRLLDAEPPLLPLVEGAALVTYGPGGTHRVACFNPPTPEERVAGRPLRDGFKAGAAPAGQSDELTERAASTADLIGLEAESGEDGPISVDRAPGACRSCPIPAIAPHGHSHDHPHDH